VVQLGAGVLVAAQKPRAIADAFMLKKRNYEQALLVGNFGKQTYDSVKAFNSPAYWSGSQDIENRK
jgi:hypothetical protein